MPNSLRCMLSKLRHKGQISDAEYKKLITKLDNHDRLIKEQTNTAEWITYKAKQGGIEEKWYKCSNCGWENALLIPREFCPKCGKKNRIPS